MKEFVIALMALLSLTMSTFLAAEDLDAPKLLSGSVGLAAKYDSDMELTLGQNSAKDEDDDFIYELSAKAALNHTWNETWHVELDIRGFGNWPMEHDNQSWYVCNSDLYLGYTFGKNAVSLLNNARYFTVPRSRIFDFFRNSATLAYKRVFSPLFEGRIGYENINNAYPVSAFYNYYLNGGFVELRNTWTPFFSTYYTYDFLFYLGGFNTQQADPQSSPGPGYRHTGELGFDWIFARKNNLSGGYTFQMDKGLEEGLAHFGKFEGEEGTLDTETDFNFIKHKGTLLFSRRFNESVIVTLYEELIHKSYDGSIDEEADDDPKRTDLLFLSSVWVTVRFYDELYGKIRYIYRMNHSSDDDESFQNHIGSVGLEYRF